MTEAEIRAYVLAESAEVERSTGAGLRTASNGHEWRLGSFGFWKTSALEMASCPVPAFRPGSPVPTYRRGSLVADLSPDLRLEAEPFNLKDGTPAIAILLRSDVDPEGSFATFTLGEEEAIRIITIVTDAMNTGRLLAAERFQASGGDPNTARSLRALSSADVSAQLDALLGKPDEQ